jgi:cobalt-zinc-cadmium efflux system outer membrane protein
MNKLILLAAGLGLSLTSQALTLDEALALARENSPGVRAAQSYEQAASRRAEVAGDWKNPELGFEGEGLGGDNNNFNEGEYSVTLKQVIPLGGKSKNQRAVAQQAIEVSTHAIVETEQELAAQVRTAFAEALAQQEISIIRDEQEKLAREFIAVA